MNCHLCWKAFSPQTPAHCTWKIHFIKEQLLLKRGCRYSPQNPNCTVTRTMPGTSHARKWLLRRGKKDWHLSEQHVGNKQGRNTLCSRPFSPDKVCSDAMLHSTRYPGHFLHGRHWRAKWSNSNVSNTGDHLFLSEQNNVIVYSFSFNNSTMYKFLQKESSHEQPNSKNT